MPSKPTKTLISCEEFERLAPTLEFSELVDGEIVHVSPAGVPHSEVSARIYDSLRDFVKPRKLGRVLSNETGLHVKHDPPRSRGADVLYISYARFPKDATMGFLTVPPELIAEVLSDPWDVMEEKVADYHAFGVDVVWVAEHRKRLLHVYPRGAAKQILRPRDYVDVGNILPGFKARVATFFE